MKKKVLMAIDGSDQSFEAVRYASKILSPNETEIVLFTVVSKIPELIWDMSIDPAFHDKVSSALAWEVRQKNMAEQYLEKVRCILLAGKFPNDAITLTIHQKNKGIARDIATESKDGYDAVVVGRTGLSKFKDIVIGSIAYKLMEKLVHVPIWVVGDSPKPGKVLVGLDASEGAMKAVDHTGFILGHSDFEVVLFNAIESIDILPSESEDFFPEGYEEKWFNEIKGGMLTLFDEATDRLIKAGFAANRISTKLITRVNSRAGAIVEEAKNGGYGTIVLGRRGLSKLEEFLMGRISNKVLHIAKEMAVWVVS